MIGVYYIATGSYKAYLEDFANSLKNFRAGKDKKIILLVDEEVDTLVWDVYVEQHLISDAPWPIIALLKMWYINKHRGEYEEVYYFNGNTSVIKDVPQCGDKMLLTRHSYHDETLLDGHKFLRIEDDNPKSLSYIGSHSYTYVQAGFFGGNADVVYRMCEDVGKWVEDDLKRGVIPKWHDESYLNKWVTMNASDCKIIDAFNENIDFLNNPNFIPKK